MDDSAPYTRLACPYPWYCNQHIGHSADDVNKHLTVTHAGIYNLSWAGNARGNHMRVSRGKDGSLKCGWKGCSSSLTGSINLLLNHLKIEHAVEATYEAKNVPKLPWPPVTADDLFAWGPKRGPKAAREELPPSQSQGAPSNQGIQSTHAVGRPSPEPFNHAPRGPEMDQVGLRSAPSSVHDDVPPPHTPLKKSPAPAPSQVLSDLRQQSPLLSQRPSQQSETQDQQPCSSRERTDLNTELKVSCDRGPESPLYQRPASQQLSAAYDSFAVLPPFLGLENYQVSVTSVKKAQFASVSVTSVKTAQFASVSTATAFTVSALVRASPCGTIRSLGSLTRN
ncbi:hypothetical protein B0H14DRAFT_3447548 [Mycena olivaceomarginata]|nr:hypothetical protein B0H14DRAFT_3447548 [Mycena olivaceomarginata]